MEKRVHHRLVLLLSCLGCAASLATLPIALALGGAFADLPPLLVLTGGLAVQALVVFALAAHLGLKAAGRVGLAGAPLLAALVGGRSVPLADARLARAIAAGLGVGLLTVVLDGVLFRGALPPAVAAFAEIAPWKRLLAGMLYAASPRRSCCAFSCSRRLSIFWLAAGDPAHGPAPGPLRSPSPWLPSSSDWAICRRQLHFLRSRRPSSRVPC